MRLAVRTKSPTVATSGTYRSAGSPVMSVISPRIIVTPHSRTAPHRAARPPRRSLAQAASGENGSERKASYQGPGRYDRRRDGHTEQAEDHMAFERDRSRREHHRPWVQ